MFYHVQQPCSHLKCVLRLCMSWCVYWLRVEIKDQIIFSYSNYKTTTKHCCPSNGNIHHQWRRQRSVHATHRRSRQQRNQSRGAGTRMWSCWPLRWWLHSIHRRCVRLVRECVCLQRVHTDDCGQKRSMEASETAFCFYFWIRRQPQWRYALLYRFFHRIFVVINALTHYELWTEQYI